jgi:hypothetical protein
MEMKYPYVPELLPCVLEAKGAAAAQEIVTMPASYGSLTPVQSVAALLRSSSALSLACVQPPSLISRKQLCVLISHLGA